MALAILSFKGAKHGQYLFDIQLGNNRFFQYTVGKKPERGMYGLYDISEPTLVSGVFGPVPEEQLGRVRFGVKEADLSSKQSRLGQTHWVQIRSYRDQSKRGIAVSEPVQIPRQMMSIDPIAFSVGERQGENMTQLQTFSNEYIPRAATSATAPVRVKSFGYTQKKYSNALFLQALLPMISGAIPAIGSAVSSAMPAITAAIPQVLPHLAPLVGSLLGSLGNQTGNSGVQRAGQTAETVLNQVSSPENAQHLAALIQQLLQLQRQTVSTTGSTPAATAVSQSYSQAQVAPILAALPALMPLLKQVLTPETVQGIVNMPNQHMQTIINGIKDVSQLALQSHEQDLRHLREIHPDMEDPELQQLLMSMSANVQTRPDYRYQRVSSVELTMKTKPVSVNGQTKVVYLHQNAEWRFPFQVSTPRLIRRPSIQCVVKEKKTLRTVISRQFTSADLNSGEWVDVISVSAEEQKQLSIGQDYIVTVHLVWKNHAGEKRGTSRQSLITPMDGALFDRLETPGQLLPLDDPTLYSDHWHKIWQDRFTSDVSQHIIETRYYLQFDPIEDRLARFESQARFKEENRQKQGQLRTGVEWTLSTINDLRKQLLPNDPPLTKAQMSALKHEDFRKRFGTVAQSRVDIRASRGKLGEIWVYPVVKIQSMVLLIPEQVTEDGLVETFRELSLDIPIPVQVHFVGFKS